MGPILLTTTKTIRALIACLGGDLNFSQYVKVCVDWVPGKSNGIGHEQDSANRKRSEFPAPTCTVIRCTFDSDPTFAPKAYDDQFRVCLLARSSSLLINRYMFLSVRYPGETLFFSLLLPQQLFPFHTSHGFRGTFAGSPALYKLYKIRCAI